MRLTRRKAIQAVRYNRARAEAVGWVGRYSQILWVLGMDRVTPSAEGFAQSLADWQARQRGLVVDGKLGPDTWRRLEPETRFSLGSSRRPEWLRPREPRQRPNTQRVRQTAPPREGVGPEWIQIALAQRRRWNEEIDSWGSDRDPGDAETYLDWDEQYFAAAPMWGGSVHAPGETPRAGRNMHWCAAFVNYCLHTAGYSHTGSAGAGSFAARNRWTFRALEEPRQGCVIVVGNGGPAHVAFLYSWEGLPSSPGGHVVTDGMRVNLLGGNQGDRISISRDRRRLIAARDRNGVTSPYFWPEVGAPNCNIDLPTERAHHCHHIHR